MSRAVARFMAVILALVLPMALAAVPPAGLVAEGEGRWADALDLYHHELAARPDAAIWLRVADIEARLDHREEAAEALRQAADLRRTDAALHRRASQAAAVAGQAREALSSAQRALELEPASTDHLRAVAELASWAGDLWLAESSNRELIRRDPADATAHLALARLNSRRGHLAEAAGDYSRYRTLRASDPAGWIEAATVHELEGDYAAAGKLLAEARRRFGPSDALARADAELLARSGRSASALAVLPQLIRQDPDRYELHLMRTLALQGLGQQGPAMESLGELERLAPGRPETPGMRLQLETPQRPSLAGRASWYDDTVGIASVQGTLGAALSPWPSGRITAAVTEWALSAPGSSPFVTDTGERRLTGQTATLQLEQVLARGFAARLEAGSFRAEERDGLPVYEAALDVRLADVAEFGVSRSHDVVMTSPRAASLGIERDLDEARLRLREGYVGSTELVASFSDHDDGNGAVEFVATQRMALRRTERYNLDLGLRGQWLGYDRHAGNGYYDPEDFRRYQGLASAWLKLGAQSGIGFSLALGPERDRELDLGYEWGGDARVEGVFGIYRDWQVRAHAGHGGRFDGTERLDAWRGTGAGLELTRRF